MNNYKLEKAYIHHIIALIVNRFNYILGEEHFKAGETVIGASNYVYQCISTDGTSWVNVGPKKDIIYEITNFLYNKTLRILNTRTANYDTLEDWKKFYNHISENFIRR